MPILSTIKGLRLFVILRTSESIMIRFFCSVQLSLSSGGFGSGGPFLGGEHYTAKGGSHNMENLYTCIKSDYARRLSCCS